jgi:excisionase family DNA binding protein
MENIKLSELPYSLTVQELVIYLRISKNTAYDLIRKGKIPGAKKIGRSIRISREAVMRWLDSAEGRRMATGK